jgi:hypothetical protein
LSKRQAIWMFVTMSGMFLCIALGAASVSFKSSWWPAPSEKVRTQLLGSLAQADEIEADPGSPTAKDRLSALQKQIDEISPPLPFGAEVTPDIGAAAGVRQYLEGVAFDGEAAKNGYPGGTDSTRARRKEALDGLRKPAPGEGLRLVWAGAGPFLIGAAVLCFLLLIMSTVGVVLFDALRDARLRRVGVLTRGVLIHARSMGFVNRRPNYELELQLPDGKTTRMQLASLFGFMPGQVFEVLIDPAHPGRAALPKSAMGDGHRTF